MSCQASTKGAQTEFEFFQQLTDYPDAIICCGPLTQIGFTGHSVTAFAKALERIGCSPDYLDLFDHEVLDSGHLSYIMCAKHWIKHSQGVAKISHTANNSEWEQLAYYIFRVTCMVNEWDYKEIVNYVSTADKRRESK